MGQTQIPTNNGSNNKEWTAVKVTGWIKGIVLAPTIWHEFSCCYNRKIVWLTWRLSNLCATSSQKTKQYIQINMLQRNKEKDS